MINPAKYYNPKLIPPGGVCFVLNFLCSPESRGMSLNVVMGYLVALG